MLCYPGDALETWQDKITLVTINGNMKEGLLGITIWHCADIAPTVIAHKLWEFPTWRQLQQTIIIQLNSDEEMSD